MGLQTEIERFFRESQTWDLEMLARSALPSYHSNYPTSPLPPGASGFQNATAKILKKSTGGVPTDFEVSMDKDYYQTELLVITTVNVPAGINEIGKRRIATLKKLHGAGGYQPYRDEVSEHYESGELEEALAQLKGEGNVVPITVKKYDFTVPTGGNLEVVAKKVVITYDSCDYILESRKAERSALEAEGKLKIPLDGYADRWPEKIELRTTKGTAGDVYLRADLP